jgi:hypothetical protein
LKKNIILFILLISTLADAKNTCASLFQTDLLMTLEGINRSNGNYISDSTIESQILSLKKRKQKEFKKLLERIKARGISSQKEINKISVEMVILLSGDKDAIDKYFFKTRDERMLESIRHQIQQRLIQKGLEDFLVANSNIYKVNLWVRTKEAVKTLLNSQLWNWLQIPWMLPEIAGKPLSEDLMQKIIWSGIEANKKEIEVYYKTQSHREMYASLRRIYAGVFLGITIMSTYHGVIDLVESQTITQRDLRATEDAAMEKAVGDFATLMGREPSTKELAMIKEIIYTPDLSRSIYK